VPRDIGKICVGFAALLWLGLLASPLPAQESEAAFFKGKTVRIIVGYGPGGGYDAYARMIK
jgi:tripartite-type tricarboxylate transporter receptor subunit TctC